MHWLQYATHVQPMSLEAIRRRRSKLLRKQSVVDIVPQGPMCGCSGRICIPKLQNPPLWKNVGAAVTLKHLYLHLEQNPSGEASKRLRLKSVV